MGVREVHHRNKREKPCRIMYRDPRNILSIKSYKRKKFEIWHLEKILSARAGCHGRSENRKWPKMAKLAFWTLIRTPLESPHDPLHDNVPLVL